MDALEQTRPLWDVAGRSWELLLSKASEMPGYWGRLTTAALPAIGWVGFGPTPDAVVAEAEAWLDDLVAAETRPRGTPEFVLEDVWEEIRCLGIVVHPGPGIGGDRLQEQDE